MAKHRNARQVIAVVAATGLLGVTAACGGGGDDSASTDAPLKVGVPIPISGPVAAIGDWTRMGIESAAKSINADGGIDGREVELVFADTEADPTKAVTAVTRLVQQDKVDLVIGPITSDEALATLPILTRANVASVNGAGSEITPKNAPYSFASLINAEDQGKAMVDFALEREGVENVGELHYSATQGKAGARGWDEELKAKNIESVSTQEFDLPVTDLTPQLLKLKKADPDVLLMFAQGGNETGKLSEGREQLNWDVPVIGSYGTTFAAQAKGVGGDETYKDFDSVTWSAFSACSEGEIRQQSVDFVDSVNTEFDAKRTTGASMDYVAIFHDALVLLKAGVEGSDSTDGDKVASWLEDNGAKEAPSLPVVHEGFAMSKDNHFLMDADSLVLVNAGEEIAPQISKRVSCD